MNKYHNYIYDKAKELKEQVGLSMSFEECREFIVDIVDETSE